MKPATVRDLHKLCVALIEDGFIDAELTLNGGEHGVGLSDGWIDYEVWSNPTSGKQFVDITP